jgi:hypothetical protein
VILLFTSRPMLLLLAGLKHQGNFFWLWKSGYHGRHKFFFWLLIFDRLDIRNLLCQKNFYLHTYSCVLCDSNVEETLVHLFLNCTFSAWCWRLVGINRNNTLPTMERLESARAAFSLPNFMEIVILMAWCIWIMCNIVIFDGVSHPSLW